MDPAAAPTIISKAKAADVPVIFFNKDPGEAALKTYDKAYFIGTNPQESGEIQGKLVGDSWKAHPEWDLNKDGVIDYVLLKGEPAIPMRKRALKYVIEKTESRWLQSETVAIRHRHVGCCQSQRHYASMVGWA